jgi:hypothetical protein
MKMFACKRAKGTPYVRGYLPGLRIAQPGGPRDMVLFTFHLKMEVELTSEMWFLITSR